jgi:hypothetical protein
MDATWPNITAKAHGFVDRLEAWGATRAGFAARYHLPAKSRFSVHIFQSYKKERAQWAKST